MSPTKGNPTLQIRLEPVLHEKLKEAAGESTAGKTGGPALFVRRLIHRELKEPLAGKDLADLLELAARAEDEALWQPERAEELEHLFSDLACLVIAEKDLVRRNFAAQILGKMAAWMMEASPSRLEFPERKS